jgi:nucleotide-binding universal stress UspA family protein
LEYTLENVKNIAVEIILVWVNSIRSKDILVPETEEMSTEKAATIRLEKIIADYSPKLKNGSKITHRICQGKVHLEIANQAKYSHADMVVCCTHGASGFEETFIGSNAYRIVMYCKCPVITVRPNYRFQAPSNIFVLPITYSFDTRQKVPFTSALAKIFNAEIHILGLHSQKNSSLNAKVNAYVAQTEALLKRVDVVTKTIFRESGNLAKTVSSYAEEVNADLVSIMTEQEGGSQGFLLGTYAQQLLSASSMPILSVSPKVLKRASFS